MPIDASNEAAGAARIRLGMVGGGRGAFIGAVHRLAARVARPIADVHAQHHLTRIIGHHRHGFAAHPGLESATDGERGIAHHLGLQPAQGHSAHEAVVRIDPLLRRVQP